MPHRYQAATEHVMITMIRNVATKVGVQFINDHFRDTRERPSMTGHPSTLDRYEILRGTMAYDNRGYDIHGKTVLLFDDVIISGSSFKVAKEALIEAGAKKVIPIVLIKGKENDPLWEKERTRRVIRHYYHERDQEGVDAVVNWPQASHSLVDIVKEMKDQLSVVQRIQLQRQKTRYDTAEDLLESIGDSFRWKYKLGQGEGAAEREIFASKPGLSGFYSAIKELRQLGEIGQLATQFHTEKYEHGKRKRLATSGDIIKYIIDLLSRSRDLEPALNYVEEIAAKIRKVEDINERLILTFRAVWLVELLIEYFQKEEFIRTENTQVVQKISSTSDPYEGQDIMQAVSLLRNKKHVVLVSQLPADDAVMEICQQLDNWGSDYRVEPRFDEIADGRRSEILNGATPVIGFTTFEGLCLLEENPEVYEKVNFVITMGALGSVNMGQKVVVLGADTLLGGRIYEMLKASYDQVIPISYNKDIFEKLDLTNQEAVEAFEEKVQPDIVITLPDYFQINHGHLYIPKGQEKNITISSCDIFEGVTLPHQTTSVIFPKKEYGHILKILEEETLNDVNGVVIRTGTIYGHNKASREFDFVERVLMNLKEGREAEVDSNAKIYPVLADDVGLLVMKLIRHNARGIYQINSTEALTEYSWALKIAQMAKDKGILPVETKMDLIKPIAEIGLQDYGMTNSDTPSSLEEGTERTLKQIFRHMSRNQFRATLLRELKIIFGGSGVAKCLLGLTAPFIFHTKLLAAAVSGASSEEDFSSSELFKVGKTLTTGEILSVIIPVAVVAVVLCFVVRWLRVKQLPYGIRRQLNKGELERIKLELLRLWSPYLSSINDPQMRTQAMSEALKEVDACITILKKKWNPMENYFNAKIAILGESEKDKFKPMRRDLTEADLERKDDIFVGELDYAVASLCGFCKASAQVLPVTSWGDVVLIQRVENPDKGKLTIPGGMVGPPGKKETNRYYYTGILELVQELGLSPGDVKGN
ncbi:MAG: sugar nucleotide-binding protein, partial [Candidatus Omnitrophota bacterium]